MRPRENQSPVASRPKTTVGQITQPALMGTSQCGTAHATNAHLAAMKTQAQTMKREIRGEERATWDMVKRVMSRSLHPRTAWRKHRPRFP